jgi:hypothetical protein
MKAAAEISARAGAFEDAWPLRVWRPALQRLRSSMRERILAPLRGEGDATIALFCPER